ncbi:unnamed protein product [Clonostachys rosea f. rosea IK726]|uniref:Uncharacterized protein n=2 Tax=Bionectria ochroleuca TaxID=29856 RepID=A0A0B7K8Y7_BIOOC|nr:unnamed protein product [Clonostachys rosea f. rosea IK726]
MSSSATRRPMRLLLVTLGSVGEGDAITTYCNHHFSRRKAHESTPGVGEDVGNGVKGDTETEAFMSENLSAPPGGSKPLSEEFIRDADAVLLVYSVTSRSTFKRVREEYDLIERLRRELDPSRRFWHQHRIPPMPIILAGSIPEMGDSRTVSTEEGIALGAELGVKFVEITVADKSPVEILFHDLVQNIRDYRFVSTAIKSWAASAIKKLRDKRLKDSMQPHQDEHFTLVEALSADEVHIARRLILDGAEINTPDSEGFLPLHLAAARGLSDLVKLLLDRGALIDRVAPLSGTALSIAAVRDQTEVVELLLEYGASLDIPADYYGTVLQAVTRRRHPSIRRRFELPSHRR